MVDIYSLGLILGQTFASSNSTSLVITRADLQTHLILSLSSAKIIAIERKKENICRTHSPHYNWGAGSGGLAVTADTTA